MTAAWTITSERQMSKARKEYFAALLRQESSWHDHTRPAETCSKMYVQISKVQQALVTNMTAVLTKISMGVSVIIVALAIGYKMAVVMILFLPIMLLSGLIRGYFLKQKEMYIQTKKVKLDSDVI
jgi:ABC-type multidrug transport system fused ATPase/permease subunit